MNMSVPVSVPAAGGKPAAVPGKGAAHAHGVTATPGQADGEAAADGVAGMFAALVAALTEQMSDVVDGDAAADAGPDGAVEGDAVVADGAVPAPVGAPVAMTPAAGTAVAAVTTDPTAATAATKGAQAAAAPVVGDAAADATTDPVVGPAPADVPVEDGSDMPGTARTGRRTDTPGAEHRATPAVPATPATPASLADGETAPATPVTPATPATPAPTVAVRGDAPTSTTPAQGTDQGASRPDAVAPAPATPTVAAPEATARVPDAAPTRPVDPHVQVARIVRTLRLGNDGAYELALDLTPAELGRVRIDVELRGSTISLSLRADNPATRELLQGSLDQLRTELETAGLQAGDLDVSGRGADGRDASDGDRHGPAVADAGEELTVVVPAETDLTTLDASNGVDVRA